MINYKKHILIQTLGTLTLATSLYSLGYYYIYTTSDKYFIEDKFAKSIHMNYTFNKNNNIDYIFIGSSRTQNHISTNILYDNNIVGYNYGRPQVYLKDIPYLVHKSIVKKPKYIVLNIFIDDLYLDIKQPTFPTLIDYDFINHYIGTSFSFNSINDIISNEFNLKDICSQVANRKTTSLIDQRYELLRIKEYEISCDITNFRGPKERTIFLCSNGDGIVVANLATQKRFKKVFMNNNISSDKITILNKLLQVIKKNNIIPIVVLEPSDYNIYKKYDINYLSHHILDTNIIDNTNFNIYNKDLWSDDHHLNHLGRKEYTQLLAKQLNLIK